MTDITTAQFVAFNLTLLAAMASPGPAFLVAVRNAIVLGRRGGILTGLGLACMAALWTTAALAGLSALFVIVPWLFGALKLGGALYLIYLAVMLWHHAPDDLTTPRKRRGNPFLAGFLVNLANPKSVLFAAAVIVVIFPAGLAPNDAALIVANHLIVEIVLYALIALVFSTPTARTTYLRAKRVLDRAAACVMGALGMRLLLSRAT
ncbi:LysE family translocator [Octadecabacter sp. R77987]|uniref:LysE family translocator n=1 Tax=Octadecabacter sp. R77987 TaxID=3093874 RepID=UPI003671E95A